MAFDTELLQSLEAFGRIVSLEPKHGEAAVAFGREQELELLARHLDNAQQNSFLLMGPSGCGKTTILKQLFRQVGTRRRKPWLVLETSSTQLFRGTRYLGDWQTQIHSLIELAKRSENIAVYCTDISNLAAAGRWSKSDENMAQAMSPFIENGELVLIGECNDETYRQGLEPYPWFQKLFALFQLQPQDGDVLESVIRQVANARGQSLHDEMGTSLTWTDESLAAIGHFGATYFPGITPPGGAVRLIESLVNAHRHRASGAGRKPSTMRVEREHVLQTLESFSGIPAQLLDDSQSLDLDQVRQFFATRVLGQDGAVSAVVDLITLVKAGLNDPEKPSGCFFCSLVPPVSARRRWSKPFPSSSLAVRSECFDSICLSSRTTVPLKN